MNSVIKSIAIQPPAWMRSLYGGALWRGDIDAQSIYLTFDDGPVPDPTLWVLSVLKEYDIKATFFCVGDNIRKHPDVFNAVIEAGHTVGNHTYNHMQAFKTSASEYYDNIEKSQKINNSRLFRPPHGQLYPWQMKRLKNEFDKVVFWDVMPLDYDASLTGKEVTHLATQYVRNGSVIVFHDSLKAKPRLTTALPTTIDFLLKKGYTFKTI